MLTGVPEGVRVRALQEATRPSMPKEGGGNGEQKSSIFKKLAERFRPRQGESAEDQLSAIAKLDLISPTPDNPPRVFAEPSPPQSFEGRALRPEPIVTDRQPQPVAHTEVVVSKNRVENYQQPGKEDVGVVQNRIQEAQRIKNAIHPSLDGGAKDQPWTMDIKKPYDDTVRRQLETMDAKMPESQRAVVDITGYKQQSRIRVQYENGVTARETVVEFVDAKGQYLRDPKGSIVSFNSDQYDAQFINPDIQTKGANYDTAIIPQFGKNGELSGTIRVKIAKPEATVNTTQQAQAAESQTLTPQQEMIKRLAETGAAVVPKPGQVVGGAEAPANSVQALMQNQNRNPAGEGEGSAQNESTSQTRLKTQVEIALESDKTVRQREQEKTQQAILIDTEKQEWEAKQLQKQESQPKSGEGSAQAVQGQSHGEIQRQQAEPVVATITQPRVTESNPTREVPIQERMTALESDLANTRALLEDALKQIKTMSADQLNTPGNSVGDKLREASAVDDTQGILGGTPRVEGKPGNLASEVSGKAPGVEVATGANPATSSAETVSSVLTPEQQARVDAAFNERLQQYPGKSALLSEDSKFAMYYKVREEVLQGNSSGSDRGGRE